jgi:hypothetical protein
VEAFSFVLGVTRLGDGDQALIENLMVSEPTEP